MQSTKTYTSLPRIFGGSVTGTHMSFARPLVMGRVIDRPNRFLVNAEIDGSVIEAHCPTTGSIGGWQLNGLSAMFSGPHSQARRTSYTLEAIQVPLSNGSLQWVGVNQSDANRYVEAAWLAELMDEMEPHADTLLRERALGQSRIDFQLQKEGVPGSTYVEVKTPLKVINLDAAVTLKPTADAHSQTDRLVRHINGLADALGTGDRAVLLSCFIYDAPHFAPPRSSAYSEVSDALDRATAAGLERWQVNFDIDVSGVSLSKMHRF